MLRDCQAGGLDGNESRDVVNGDMKLVGVRVKDAEGRNYNIVLMIPECLK